MTKHISDINEAKSGIASGKMGQPPSPRRRSGQAPPTKLLAGQAGTVPIFPIQKNSYGAYILFTLIILILGYLIVKDVSMPTSVTLPIAVIGLLVLLQRSLTKPEITLLCLVAYVPFSLIFVGKFGGEAVGINFTNILTIVVLIGWISSSASRGVRLSNKAALNLPILGFCLWGFIGIIRARLVYGGAYDLDSYFILFKRWITPMLLYFIALNMVKDKATFKKVVFVMMIVTFIIAIMAIKDYAEGGTRSSLEDSRVGGVFEQPNMLGGYFVYMMFFFLSFFLSYWRSFKYWLLLIPFLACFRGIMVTFSRGAYLACAFGGLMTTFFKNKALFVVAIILLCFSLMIPGVMPEGIRYRLASTFGGSNKVLSTNVEDITDKSAEIRIIIWKGAIEMIKDQPVFGFGYGMFPYVIGSYAPTVEGRDAHNTYLILAAEMGIPALVLFLIILALLIANARWLYIRSKDRYFKAFALGVLGGLFGLLLVNMFGSRLNSEEVSSYFWVYSGLLMAAVRMKREGLID